MEVLDYFKLPEKAKAVEQRLFINQLVEQSGASGNDKKLFENSIKSFYLVAALSEETCGIWSFKNDEYYYEMILIFQVFLKDRSKVKSLNELLQKTFPNPTIILYKYGDENMISTAMKRLNKVEKGKSVIDSFQTSGWFKIDSQHDQLLKKISLSKKNLKEFYESIDYLISAEYIVQITGKVPEILDFSIKGKSLMIQQLLEEKTKLINQEKEESSMQGQMKCHMRIKEIDKQLETIK